MTSWTAAIAALATANDGLILTRDLKQLGFSDQALRSVRPELHKICHGAYTLAPPGSAEEQHRLHVRAAVLRHEHDVAASSISAAVVNGFPLWDVDLATVHVTARLAGVRDGARHRVRTHRGPLPDADVGHVGGVPVTTPGRTTIDCARRLPLPQAVALADHALHHGLVARTELEQRLEALGPVPGIGNVRRLLALADGRAETVGETRTRLILTDGGILVDPQVDIWSPDGTWLARADLRVRHKWVVVEFDGRGKYSIGGDPESAHWQEKQRQNRLEDAGFVVVRVTWADLTEPRRIVARVRAAMERATALHR